MVGIFSLCSDTWVEQLSNYFQVVGRAYPVAKRRLWPAIIGLARTLERTFRVGKMAYVPSITFRESPLGPWGAQKGSSVQLGKISKRGTPPAQKRMLV